MSDIKLPISSKGSKFIREDHVKESEVVESHLNQINSAVNTNTLRISRDSKLLQTKITEYNGKLEVLDNINKRLNAMENKKSFWAKIWPLWNW